VIGIATGRGGDFQTGVNVRKRIASRVRPHFETDEGLGTLRKLSDAPLLLKKIETLLTGPEIAPFLDSLLLSVPVNPAVLDLIAPNLSSLTKVLQGLALDRQAVVRVLLLVKLFDEEVLAKAEGLQELIAAAQKLIDDTIDPTIRQHATEAVGYLQATSAALGMTARVLTGEELIRFRKEGKLCLKCDTNDHSECAKTPTVCLNCRGPRLECIRGCKQPCRVCGSPHPDKALLTCLESVAAPKPAKRVVEDDLFEFSDDEVKDAKKMRSVKEYRENKRKAKEEKKTHATVPAATEFEKLLKDTVAKICFEKLAGKEEDHVVEVPQWRKVYRAISASLMEKESRLVEGVRFRCKTAEEQAAVVRRVSEYTNDYLKKHQQ